MKGVEFINSRVEEGRRSQPSTDDYPVPSMSRTTGGASEPPRLSPSLTHDERNVVLSVLRNFTDILTIFRCTLDNREVHKNAKEPFNEHDLHRQEAIIQMQRDSLYVSNLFENLIKDVEIGGCYSVLVGEIEDKRKRQDDEVAVARDYTEARKRVAQLRKLVEEETKANAAEREELKAQLVNSKNEKKRLELKVGIESRYVRAWEKARYEASSLRSGIALKSLEDALGNLSSEERNECRVATEIEAFLEQNVTANKRAASHWQERYELKMQMYKSENGRLNAEIENRRQVLEKLQLEFRERQEFIEKYVEEKEAAMEQKKREKHRQNCSIRIQAWWRGVMVRRKLGPYRPDEKKKKRAVKSKK